VLRSVLTTGAVIGVICTHVRPGHALQAAPPLRVQRAEIMDRQGFEKPMVAFTLLVPAGWRSEGGVQWAGLDGCSPAHVVNWKASAPDGVGAMQVIPGEKWSASTLPPQQGDRCLHSDASATRAYLEWWVRRNRPGARVLDYRPLPELLENLKGLQLNNPELGMRSWVDAGEVLVAYDVAGRPVREAIASVSFFIHTTMPTLGAGRPPEVLEGESLSGFAMRMPAGALDFKQVTALRQAIHVAPEWNARVVQGINERGRIAMESNRVIAEQNRRGAAERSAIIARTGREVNEIQMGTWQSRNESMDRTQRESIESIRGVETYNDAKYGGTVQLSNQYQQAWQLSDGSYVLTDDVHFDPNRTFGVSGQRLTVTP
jgi:hypothetical protein